MLQSNNTQKNLLIWKDYKHMYRNSIWLHIKIKSAGHNIAHWVVMWLWTSPNTRCNDRCHTNTLFVWYSAAQKNWPIWIWTFVNLWFVKLVQRVIYCRWRLYDRSFWHTDSAVTVQELLHSTFYTYFIPFCLTWWTFGYCVLMLGSLKDRKVHCFKWPFWANLSPLFLMEFQENPWLKIKSHSLFFSSVKKWVWVKIIKVFNKKVFEKITVYKIS